MKGGKKQHEAQEASVIIDAGEGYDKDNLISFLSDCYKQRNKRELEYENTSDLRGLFCMLFKDVKTMHSIVELNGTKYKKTKLLITQFNWEKYRKHPKILDKEISERYSDGVIDFTSFREEGINYNYFVDFQWFLMYIGSYARRNDLDVTTLNFSKNEIRMPKNFKNINIFLPKLKCVILDKNPIKDTSDFENIFIGLKVKFNDMNFGEAQSSDDSSEENSNSNSSAASSPAQSSSKSSSAQSSDNSDDNDEGSSDDDDDEEEHVAPPPKQPRITETRSNPSPSQNCFDEVKDFIMDFILTSSGNLAEIGDFYTRGAQFTFLTKRLNVSDKLFALKDYNQNMEFLADPNDAVTKGDSNIAEKMKKISPNGIMMEFDDLHCNKIEGLFYSVLINGSITIADNACKFARTLTIVGENGRLLISNDVLFIA